MRRNLLMTCSLILFSVSSIWAKEIKGVVVDTDSISVEFVNITAFATDSVVGGGVTDASGNFRIEVGPDCNKIRVSFIGYDDVVLSRIQSDMGRQSHVELLL